MNIIFFLIPLALLLSGTFAITFIYAVLKGQYDDLETPAYRMLINEEKIKNQNVSGTTGREG